MVKTITLTLQRSTDLRTQASVCSSWLYCTAVGGDQRASSGAVPTGFTPPHLRCKCSHLPAKAGYASPNSHERSTRVPLRQNCQMFAPVTNPGAGEFDIHRANSHCSMRTPPAGVTSPSPRLFHTLRSYLRDLSADGQLRFLASTREAQRPRSRGVAAWSPFDSHSPGASSDKATVSTPPLFQLSTVTDLPGR